MRTTADLIRTAIRVEIARQDVNQTKVAQAVGKSGSWISTRLAGNTPITLDDLDLIAEGLHKTSGDLIGAALAERSSSTSGHAA